MRGRYAAWRAWPRGLLLAALLLGSAGAAAAYVPTAERIAGGLARANRKAHRGAPLQLQLGFLMDEIEVATGTLVSDPAGFARLELRHQKGFRERHLLRGGRYEASRDGARLAAPRPLLPPFPLLQAIDPDALLALLQQLGVETGRVELGYEGDHDCYVIGGRGGGPAVWVDQDDLEVVRVDLAGGTHLWMGPLREAGHLRLPSWIEVAEPGAETIRIEIRRVSTTKIQPGTFQDDWLRG